MTFIEKLSEKFTVDRVKEFMEIQLMHANELSLKLIDWIDNHFRRGGANLDESQTEKVTIPKVELSGLAPSADDNHDSSHKSLHSQAASAIGGRDRANSGSNSARNSGLTPRTHLQASQSYKERRDLYK